MRNLSVVLVLVASGVSALELVPRDAFNALLPRQTSACTSTCAPFQSTVNSCADLACLCTTATANSLQVCVNCAVAAAPNSADVISAATTLISTFENSCSGFSLPTVTIDTLGAGPTTSTAATASVPLTLTGTSTASQVIIRPSSTTDNTLPSSTSTTASSSSIPGLKGSSGYAVLVPKGLVMTIAAALGMALVC